jgi:CheY-like chemotaxis protein
MSRILLVDDSPHAQRMGERILTDEGYEVVTVSNADSALIRLDDVDPDVVIADTVMPGRTGYEICQYLKMSPRHRHVRVILTAGVLEIFDLERATRVESDGVLKKPFEASALLSAVKPLAEAATHDRAAPPAPDAPASGAVPPPPQSLPGGVPFIAVVDAGLIRAAVTVALDASMESMVEQITRRVLANLHSRSAEPRNFQPDMAPLQPEPPKPAAPPPPVNPIEPVRRVTPLRIRSGSILGLDLSRPDPPPEIPPDNE